MVPLILLVIAAACGRDKGREKVAVGLHWVFDDTTRQREIRRVLVDLAPQLDLARLDDSLQRAAATRQARRHAVVAALRRVAEASQGRLRPLLERLQHRGAIEGYTGFVITNRVLVTATPAGIRALAGEREVIAVVEETLSHSGELTGGLPAATPGFPTASWALDSVGAREAWRQGLDGGGVVVGIIDAGASAAHEQLRHNYRGGDSSWHMPSAAPNARSTPADILRGHGTGVLSAAVGRSAGGRTIGVAPGARWVACAGLPEGRYNNVTMTQCADWMLTTGQPDVLLNPWQLPEPGCNRALERIVAAWRTAGIVSVFAAGNRGPAAPSDRSPANYATLSVGAVTPTGALVARSSRGPNSCDGSVYPTLVAPGAAVPVAYPLTESAYILSEGSSVAAGFAAGIVALLLQRDPAATVVDVERALRDGARDAGPPGPDNEFGYGRLSATGALAALARLRSTMSTSSNNVAPAQKYTSQSP